MISAELMYEKVMHRMDMTKETKEEELQEIIRTVLEDESKKEFIPLSEKIRLSRELFNAFRRLDILQDLIEDDSITEIMVNGTENIFYEKEGKLYRTNRHFFSESRLCDVIQQIVGEANRYVNETSPIVDARLADGSRVNVVLKPVAVNGPIMTIRKFPSKAIKMNDLIKMGSLTKEAAEFIRKIVRSKYNIFVSGGTGAGKTTFLNAMSDFIPKEERIITIEDNEHFSRLVQESPPYAKNTQKQGSWQYTVYCRYTDPKQDESFQHPKYRAFYIQSWEGLHCQKDFFQSIPNEQLA